MWIKLSLALLLVRHVTDGLSCDTIQISGATGDIADYNGDYTYQGELSGYPVYELDVSAYIWWYAYNSVWIIGPYIQDHNFTKAFGSGGDTPDTVTTWEVYDSSGSATASSISALCMVDCACTYDYYVGQQVTAASDITQGSKSISAGGLGTVHCGNSDNGYVYVVWDDYVTNGGGGFYGGTCDFASSCGYGKHSEQTVLRATCDELSVPSGDSSNYAFKASGSFDTFGTKFDDSNSGHDAFPSSNPFVNPRRSSVAGSFAEKGADGFRPPSVHIIGAAGIAVGFGATLVAVFVIFKRRAEYERVLQ